MTALKDFVLGIELGSTRIKAVLLDKAHRPVASGSYSWENELKDGVWTYSLEDAEKGLQACFADLRQDAEGKLGEKLSTVGAIGISAMMHGYLAFDGKGNLLVPFRTWRNTMTGEAAEKLSALFGFNIPQRWSIAHLEQALLNKEAHLGDLRFFTTLAGWVHWRLTGETDTGHTCAWTLGKKQIQRGGESRVLLLVTVRGTNAGEWYSNFDFAPSRDENTCYAENFLACAEDVLNGLRDTLEAEEAPLLLLCGHSRGAACANLLGLLLDEERGSEDIYCYTFATPTTVRGEVLERSYPNIFNLLNPCDLVTLLPPPSLGFGRAGRDIVLPNDQDAAQALAAGIENLSSLIPGIDAYYTVRHSLTGPGLSDEGMTAYEFLCAAAAAFSGAGGVSLFTEGAPVTVAPDSDFAPLLGLLAGSGEAGSTQALNVAMQHMPITYMALMMASAFFG